MGAPSCGDLLPIQYLTVSKNQLIYFFCSFLYRTIRNMCHFWHHSKKKAEFFLILPLLNAGVLEDLSQWMSVLCIYQFINLSGQFLKAPVNLHTRIWVGTLEYHSYSPLFVQRGFLSDVKSVIRLCLPPQVKDVMFLVLPLVGVLHTVNNFHRHEILREKKKLTQSPD